RAAKVADLLREGRGRLDLAILPADFDASVFDLWAVNLLAAIARKLDDEHDSGVNCILARFSVEDGVLTDDLVFMDTTRVVVAGSARVDFEQETLDIRAKPKAKRAQL
ncbi:MAG: hypothetical protein GWN07_36665, partial [Actinobacteria bacterium]|nr:hypothetical protein [Actinomycetota bacterium]NIX25042.1 hypothetical protein [Actinomycetota bacterium]